MVNAHEEKRMQKVRMIMNTLRKKDEDDEDKGIDEDVLISLTCLEFGAGRRYVKEIIRDLQITKKIVISEKKVYYVPLSKELTSFENDIVSDSI